MSLPKSLKQELKEEKEAFLKERDAEKLGSKVNKESEEKVATKVKKK